MAKIIRLSRRQQRELSNGGTCWIRTSSSEDIASKMRARSPLLYDFLSKMPNFEAAMGTVDDIANGRTTPEAAGISQDVIGQAKQVIGKARAASSRGMTREAFNFDVRVIAAIILIILGFWSVKALSQPSSKTQGSGLTQSEQLQQQLAEK